MNRKQGVKTLDITVKFKINPSKEQIELLKEISLEYIKTVNAIVSDMVSANLLIKLSSKDISANMPSAIKNQAIRDSKSVFSKYRKDMKINLKKQFEEQKEVTIPVLKKPVCIWNNQNYSYKDGVLNFPVNINGKSQRISVNAMTTDYQIQRLNGKQGSLRIIQKSGKWIAQICVCVPDKAKVESKTVMGVDLGLKVPAVAVTDTGKTGFFGNGRMNKYIKRKFRAKRKELGKAKKLKAIRNLNDKEQRWMKDQDHKISRSIINFAIENNVSVIRMEKLTNIRNTARTSRKNEKNLHTWSFYRLAKFIEYKARLVGIVVEYAAPEHTSQICPACGKLNKAKDRKYQCSCNFKTHRDRVGAINIIYAPVADGNSLSA